MHIAISERSKASDSQRDAVYNEILRFIGVPEVSNFSDHGKVFTRPGSYSASNTTLTHDAAHFLRRLYANDTSHLYTRLGYEVAEWETWYSEHGLGGVE